MYMPEVSCHSLTRKRVTNEGVASATVTQTCEAAIPKHTLYVTLKYLVETAAALALLVLFSPVILIAAALVTLTSAGPAFYCQTRLGRNGRNFKVFKLRSMVHNAEASTGATWCQLNDSRITPVGRLLRDTHIDELPQLINVVLGQMSLVGPRPERPELAANLLRQLPRFNERLNVRPGITGFAQLRLPPDTDLESVRRKLAYDLYYVRNVNAWLDLRILLLTLQLFIKSLLASLWTFVALPSREMIEAHLVAINNGEPASLFGDETPCSFRPENRPPLVLQESQSA